MSTLLSDIDPATATATDPATDTYTDITDATTEDGHAHAHGIDESVLRRIANSWPRRATIRTDLDQVTDPGSTTPRCPTTPSTCCRSPSTRSTWPRARRPASGC